MAIRFIIKIRFLRKSLLRFFSKKKYVNCHLCFSIIFRWWKMFLKSLFWNINVASFKISYPDSVGVKYIFYLVACRSIIFVSFSVLKSIIFVIQSDHIFVRFGPVLFFGWGKKSVKYNAENVDARSHHKNVTPSFAGITRILVTLEKLVLLWDF